MLETQQGLLVNEVLQKRRAAHLNALPAASYATTKLVPCSRASRTDEPGLEVIKENKTRSKVPCPRFDERSFVLKAPEWLDCPMKE